MHRSLTLTVSFLQLAVRKLKSLTNWYWFLTNLPGQWPPWGAPQGWGEKVEPATTLVTGGGHGKDSSQGIRFIGRSRRIRAESGQEPVRSVPARAALHARAWAQVARQARPCVRLLSGGSRAGSGAREALILGPRPGHR